ncbi:putative Ig domain-containing protein [Tropheryma whipplei]|uniref:putative Ig domain-containing protein n=1 Tax=Tropheryma whipplei TaxID=2039 RepID=UPI0002D430F0|nr:putative Ig domain-containing protein [Tropheryma whipplei]
MPLTHHIYTVVVTGTAPTVTNNATTLTSTIVSATYTFLVTSTTPGLSSTATGVSIGQTNITITPTTQGYITSYTVASTDATSGGTSANGLPKGLTLNSSGTITGSIDTSVTPGEYKVSFYAFASPVATLRIPSYLVTYTFYVLPSNSSSVHALTSPSRACNKQTYCGLIMQNIALDDASTSFTVKAIPNYYDYPSDFKNKLSHRVTSVM